MRRYTQKQKISQLKERYDHVIGWGAGKDEFLTRYNPSLYQLDYMIDGKGQYQGETRCGVQISPPSILKELVGQKICFVIFPNVEEEIIGQILEYLDDFDVIVSRLLDCGTVITARTFSTDREDQILAQAALRLGIKRPYYVDIGVCHPVIRNNTYLFYENGYRDGLLIEPNPAMCRLAREYRPENKIVEAGVCSGEGGYMRYYLHPVSTYVGHNTFDVEIARGWGTELKWMDIPVRNINEVFQEYCQRCPDVIDIDTEGMDFDLLEALDLKQYRAKLICAEVSKHRENLDRMMRNKGYVHFMETSENVMYLAEECLSKFC